MANAKKKVSYRFQTPVGTLSYIHAVKPDLKYGPTYQVTFETEDGEKLIAQMESLNTSFKGKIPYKKLEGGGVSLKIKQKRYISWFDKDGKKQERECIPVLLNADQTPYTGTENPWGGSTGEVAMTVDLTKDQQGNPTVALRLVGIRFHSVATGSQAAQDPLFGGGKPKTDGETEEDLPEFSGEDDNFDDDIPF